MMGETIRNKDRNEDRNKDMDSMVFGLRSWECTNTAFSSSVLYLPYLKELYEKGKIRIEPQNFVLLLYGPVPNDLPYMNAWESLSSRTE